MLDSDGHTELDAHTFYHKTFRTFIPSLDGPVQNASELRRNLIEHYHQKPNIADWDEYGLGAYVRLSLRNGDVGRAVETTKDWRFLKRFANFPTYSADSLREMVSWVLGE